VIHHGIVERGNKFNTAHSSSTLHSYQNVLEEFYKYYSGSPMLDSYCHVLYQPRSNASLLSVIIDYRVAFKSLSHSSAHYI